MNKRNTVELPWNFDAWYKKFFVEHEDNTNLHRTEITLGASRNRYQETPRRYEENGVRREMNTETRTTPDGTIVKQAHYRHSAVIAITLPAVVTPDGIGTLSPGHPATPVVIIHYSLN